MEQITEIPVDKITIHPKNPRRVRKADTKTQSLALNIKVEGVLQPLRVRRNGGMAHQLIFGTRRLVASRIAGLKVVPVIVTECTETKALEMMVSENMQREDLTPLEEARNVKTLLEQDGADNRSVAIILGKTVQWVALRARLLTLSESWIKAIEQPEHPASFLSVAHLEIVARLERDGQDEALDLHLWAGMTVKELEEHLAHFTQKLALAPWDVADSILDAKAGPCTRCEKRSCCAPGLFDDQPVEPMSKDDRCLDKPCWDGKLQAFIEGRANELKREYPDLVFLSEHFDFNLKAPDGTTPRAFHEIEFCKKTDEGAQAAFVLKGNHVGRLKWIKKEEKGGSSSPSTKDKTKDTPQRQLEKRRFRRAAEKLEKLIRSTKVQPINDGDIVAAAAVFGTEFHLDTLYDGPGQANAWKRWEVLRKKGINRIGVDLWKAVKPVLLSRMRYHGSQTDVDEMWETACRTARLVDLDPEKFLAEAIEELPEPKAWAKQREKDAGKSAAKPKKAAKKKARKKKTSKVKAAAKKA